MLANEIRIVQQTVGGTTETIEKTLPSTEFAVKMDGRQYQPAVTTDVEIENNGDLTRTQDQCGHTSAARTTNNGWSITISGIVTGNDGRDGNMSVQMLRDVVAPATSVQIRTDLISGQFEVSNTVITQPNDLVSVQTNETDGEEKAFEFQLQLGETNSEN